MGVIDVRYLRARSRDPAFVWVHPDDDRCRIVAAAPLWIEVKSEIFEGCSL
jgi:hypothetical protein